MSEMIERVAKAIFASDMKWAPVLEHQFEENKIVYLKAARAAIEAMREPTEIMIEASNREWDGRMSHRSSGAWQAMIDAALVSPASRGTEA